MLEAVMPVMNKDDIVCIAAMKRSQWRDMRGRSVERLVLAKPKDRERRRSMNCTASDL